jgi:hypothetical protein
MRREEHLKTDMFFWNKEYNEVHAWLDECFPKYRDEKHWQERHHLQAIGEKWSEGTPEYNSAYMHILCDFLSHYQIAWVPKNKEEVLSFIKSSDPFGGH